VANESVLIDALRVGEKGGLLALGQLDSDNAPCDRRQSYVALFCREPITRPSDPGIGKRGLWRAGDH